MGRKIEIEQRDVIEMLRRGHQTLANLRIISDAVAGGRSDAHSLEALAAALNIVRANGERAGRQARRMLRSIEAVEAGDDIPSSREVRGILRGAAS